MTLSKSLVQPYRRNQLLLGAGWRAFFAPFNIAYNASQNNTALGPTILDLQALGPFNTNAMPAGWYDLGWINSYKMTPQSKIGSIKSGYRGVTRQKVRGEVGEEFEFKFREFTRMAFKISTGCEIFNMLAVPAGNAQSVGPLSATGATTFTLGVSGYVASNQAGGSLAPYVGSPVLYITSGQGASFNVNDKIVCDVDFIASAWTNGGLAGSNAIPIYPNNAPNDIDFIRKTSDFVGRVTAVVTGVAGQDVLVLSQPFMGGGSSGTVNPGPTTPPAGSKIQKMSGYLSREGGTFVMDWSALFVLDSLDGDQFVQYYPHVSISQFKDVANWSINNIGTTDLTGYELDATLEALGFEDPLDGETVVCYRGFYPNVGQDIAI